MDSAEDPTPTEDCYYESMSKLHTRLAEISQRAEAKGTKSTPSSSTLKLPQVSIPSFDGKYVEYKPFIELFNAFIHNDKGFDDIQKIFY